MWLSSTWFCEGKSKTGDEASAAAQAAGEKYKLEILQSIVARDPQASITIYHIGAV